MPFDLEKIGRFLKARREEKGFTITQISSVLCVRKSLIEAMEQGNWAMLPHHVYVRGYVKEYANFLNVFSEIADDFVEEEKAAPPEIPVQQMVEPPRKKIPRKVFVYSVIFFVLLGYLIVNRVQRDQQPYAPTVEATSHISSTGVFSPGPADNMPSSSNVPDKKMLMISCHERTWISVIIDGTEKKEFMLNPQEVIMLSAKERFDLLIGNAAGIKMFLNGKDVQFSGKNGEVKRVQLS
ncbi:MAG: helix-turn-helix domain-containing protein [Syntrophorhabdaceae bacterium]|nr:helix-turn-helix domain-containing protein [Syntrophorhabdaceae bacterium]